MFYLFIFIFGISIGSFLNSVIYRLENNIPILKFKTRSICPNCKKKLEWFELIPLISFIIQKGKCRGCLQKISWQYPLVEIATGLLFMGIMNWELGIINWETGSIFLIPNSLFLIQVIYFLLIACLLILIAVFDFKYYIIPNQFVYSLILLAGGYLLLTNFLYPPLLSSFKILNENLNFETFKLLNILGNKFGSTLFIAIIFSAFFLSLTLVSKGRWMGMGDAKLVLFMGLFLGWPNIVLALFSAFLLGTVVSLPLIFLNKKTFQSQIPFGPFLIIGTFITLFWSKYFLKFIL